MKQLVQHYNDAYIFTEHKTPGIKLTINCHGQFSLDRRNRAKINNQLCDARGIYNIIQNLNINNIYHVHLAICHSADSFGSSLAAELSRIMRDTYVTGYAGVVTTGFPQEDANEMFEDFGNGPEFNQDLNDHFRVFKRDDPINNTINVYFHRIKFKNGELYKQYSQIVSLKSIINGEETTYMQL
ncbi:MAG: hypothetical protein LBI75_04795 [Brucellaceae bacterium]|nr:hypothetical protein [Brucellaceae bacterium]